MPIENKIMLITYADSMGENLKETQQILHNFFKECIGSVHFLPFYPYSGDRGFAPLTYFEIDPVFGNWGDIKALGKEFGLMYDFMINHISSRSVYFQDYLAKKEKSDYADFFIPYSRFWPNGAPTEQDLAVMFRREAKEPYLDVTFGDGSSEKVWCTFSSEQIDLNVYHEKVRRFIRENLEFLAKTGVSMVRLDAFAYATKKPGTKCFFVEPDAWELLDYARSILKPFGVEILPEIHDHYTTQLKLAEKGYFVYDFNLPMLMLHAIFTGSNKRLLHWLKICPHKQFTTLDTHDGMGVVDVKDLMSDEEIQATKNVLLEKHEILRQMYSSEMYRNFHDYQMNCTYYSALDCNDDAYLMARAIQFFAPGIPQVYYVGMLAGKNDIDFYKRTKAGRDINRHYYTREEIAENVERPVVKRLLALMKFRNTCKAFDGGYRVFAEDDSSICIEREKDGCKAILHAELTTCRFSIHCFENYGQMTKLTF